MFIINWDDGDDVNRAVYYIIFTNRFLENPKELVVLVRSNAVGTTVSRLLTFKYQRVPFCILIIEKYYFG